MKNTIIIILSIAVIALGGYFVYDKVMVKNDKKLDSENNDNVENNKPTEDKNDVYGYIAVNKNNVSKVVELHKNSENKVLASHSDTIYSFTQKHNKLYYYTQGSEKPYFERVFYIDLSDKMPVELAAGVDVDYYFDNSDNYLFSAMQHNGIQRYNLNTKDKINILKNSEVTGSYELFIYDSIIYSYSIVGTENKYYTIDLDGNNFKWITKTQYDNAKKSIDYKASIDLYENINFIYNNVEVSVKDDNTKLVYGDEVVYTATDGKGIILVYTDKPNTIAFEVMKKDGVIVTDIKYYEYNIETKKIVTTSKNDIYEIFGFIIN